MWYSMIGALGAMALGFVAPPAAAGHGAAHKYWQQAQQPLAWQVALLDTSIEIEFGHELRTVGDAVHRLLTGTGYDLLRSPHYAHGQKTLLALPLPQQHRQIGPVSLVDALRLLAGDQWDLVVDPVHRLLAYELRAPWRVDAHTEAGAPRRLPSVAPHRRGFAVHAGSLIDNIARLCTEHGWHLKIDALARDWQVEAPWHLRTSSFVDALTELIAPYQLQALLSSADRVVTLRPAEPHTSW